MATDIIPAKTSMFPPPWETFARARVAGKTQRDAWCEAYPDRMDGISFSTQRQNGSDLDRRPEVRDRVAELRADAMAEAKHDGADLVRSLATEIADARTVEDATAVKRRLDALEDDACAHGVNGLQVRASICMCRVKLIEVLGRLRLQALGHLTRYASRARFTGRDDAPVRVQINFGGAGPDSVQVRGGGQAGEPAEAEEVMPPDAGS